MMKLRRPLCSDVTLRLAVDLTPEDEYCFHDDRPSLDATNENLSAHQETNMTRSDDNRRQDFGNNNNNNSNNSTAHQDYGGSSGSSGSSVPCGRAGHVCSWYSRQGTPDKTAKDIYNHEHLHTDAKQFSTRPLDSEFKRHVEEEGNDFKEVALCEEMANGQIRKTSSHDGTRRTRRGDQHDDSVRKYINDDVDDDDEEDEVIPMSDEDRPGATPSPGHPKRQSPCFADAELSGCFPDSEHANRPAGDTIPRFPTVVQACRNSLPEDRSNNNDNSNNSSNRSNSSNSSCRDSTNSSAASNVRNCLDLGQELQQALTGGKTERGHDYEDDDFDDEEDEDEDEDGSDDFALSNEDLPEAPPEIPVDMDEDVDEGMEILDPSLVMSIHGELSELDPLCQGTDTDQRPGMKVEEVPDEMLKSIAEEIHEVLTDGDKDESVVGAAAEGQAPLRNQLPFHYPFTMKHVGYLFDKSRHHFTSSRPDKPKKSARSSRSSTACKSSRASPTYAQRISFTNPPPDDTEAKPSESDAHDGGIPHGASGTVRVSVATMTGPSQASPPPTGVSDLEVTHRGLHRFIPRHPDEINVGIGDPIHVIREYDDLWCEAINLATNERGIFPAMYANDLKFLDESDDDEEEYWKFNMKFLGSMEVTAHKGDDILLYAINKVARSHQGKIHNAAVCILEINQYGIRMIDKSKDGHEKDNFSHFFALKNISFCGTHPKDNRYFAFITKHPRDYKFACHVFHGNRPTHRARDALGEAFKRFYQEYMAFTHPTEDIYIE